MTLSEASFCPLTCSTVTDILLDRVREEFARITFLGSKSGRETESTADSSILILGGSKYDD